MRKATTVIVGAGHAGLARPSDHVVPIALELLLVEMSMRIEEFHTIGTRHTGAPNASIQPLQRPLRALLTTP